MTTTSASTKVTFINARTAPLKRDDNFVFRNLLHIGEVSVCYGDSNVGKSFFAIELGRRVCEGEAIGPHECDPGSVIYAATEAPASVINRASLNELPAQGGQFLVSGASLDLTSQESVRAWIEAVRHEQDELDTEFRLFVIDTLSLALHGADENNASVMANVIQNAKTIAEELSVHTFIIHHEGKDTSRGGRGSSAIRGTVDTMLHLTRNDDEEKVIVSCAKQRNRPKFKPFAFKISSVPMSDPGAQDGSPTMIPRVEFIDLGEQVAVSPTKVGYAQRKSAMEGFYRALQLVGKSPEEVTDEDLAENLPEYLFAGCQEKTRIKRVQEIRRELRK